MSLKILSLEDYFNEKIQSSVIPCGDNTKAYIVSTFVSFKYTTNDLSDKSIFIEFERANSENKFELYQQVGDWILFARTVYPASLRVSDGLSDMIAKTSYRNCYKIVRQWTIFEELSERFSDIVSSLHAELHSS